MASSLQRYVIVLVPVELCTNGNNWLWHFSLKIVIMMKIRNLSIWMFIHMQWVVVAVQGANYATVDVQINFPWPALLHAEVQKHQVAPFSEPTHSCGVVCYFFHWILAEGPHRSGCELKCGNKTGDLDPFFWWTPHTLYETLLLLWSYGQCCLA